MQKKKTTHNIQMNQLVTMRIEEGVQVSSIIPSMSVSDPTVAALREIWIKVVPVLAPYRQRQHHEEIVQMVICWLEQHRQTTVVLVNLV